MFHNHLTCNYLVDNLNSLYLPFSLKKLMLYNNLISENRCISIVLCYSQYVIAILL